MPDTNKPEHPALLSIDGVAELLGTSPRHIRRLVAERRVPHHKVGGLVRFRTERSGELFFGSTKTYERRSVPIPPFIADELAAHLSTRPSDPDAFVFTGPEGGPFRHANFYQRHYKRAVVQAGLDPRTRFHDLRHTAAALMVAEGAHLLAVKERLGHSSIQVTADRYGHLFPSHEEALTARLDASFRAAVKRRRSAV